MGRFWDASGTPLGRFWDVWSGTFLGRLWDASGAPRGHVWDASGTPLKQLFVAGRKRDRLDENRGFRMERWQDGIIVIDSLMLSDVSKSSKNLGSGRNFYKS